MSLRIGLLAPIFHALPPPSYGPWERVAYELVEGLTELGHEVTLFAPDGTETSAYRLVTTAPRPLDVPGMNSRLWEERHIAMAAAMAASGEFDLLHSHLHVHALGYSRLLGCPMVTTLHGAAWNREVRSMLLAYTAEPFVSISKAERSFRPELNYVATVHNGINAAAFPLRRFKDDYLAFAGRIAPEKGPDLAIAVARRSGRRLLLAGPVEARHQDYFDSQIQPHLNQRDISYLGNLEQGDLVDVLGRASALLMPLRWDEPFGLIVVEAMAMGTPIIAWKRGAMPEIVRHGESGFLVNSVGEAVTAVTWLSAIDPVACRNRVLGRFDRRAMAAGYSTVYARLLERGARRPETDHPREVERLAPITSRQNYG